MLWSGVPNKFDLIWFELSFRISRMNSWTLSLHRSCLCWRCYHTYVWSAPSRQCPPIMGGATGSVGDNVLNRNRVCVGGGPMKMTFASMFINATIRQQISIYSMGPTDICLLVPHILKSGDTFFCSLRSRILFCTPTLKSAAPPMPPINVFAAPLELSYQNHGPKENQKTWVQVTRRRQSS